MTEENVILRWKTQERKKALYIIGARKIGKTTLVREFGRNHDEHFIELNFVTDPSVCAIFDGSLDANTIITNLSAYVRQPMEPGKTLILFDEV